MANNAIIKNTTVNIGDFVKVHQKIKEGDKERVQIFSGIIIRIKGHGENKSFTVRRIASGAIGVERIWSINTPWISKIEIIKKGHVKRAKLYYLRSRVGKKATRIKTKKDEKTEKKLKVRKLATRKSTENKEKKKKSSQSGEQFKSKTSSK